MTENLDSGILRLVGELENATGRAWENWQRLKKAFDLAEEMAKSRGPKANNQRRSAVV